MSKVKDCEKCKREILEENKIHIINLTVLYKLYQCSYCGAYQV